jgi:hypothetical protein
MPKKTVFIIGAGASKEANLPTGIELKSEISHLLDIRFDNYKQNHGDYLITNALREHVKNPDGRNGDINPFIQEARHIRDALPLAISIDNFIDAHKENEKIALCGKLAIVRSIIKAERRSLLYLDEQRYDSTIRFSSLEETWYVPFFQILTENCEINDLKIRFQATTFIIFNYDRCVEHFLQQALKNYYKISDSESQELVSYLNIYHPYGSVGELWDGPRNSIKFGKKPNESQLLKLAQKIKTFTEGTDPKSSEIVAIKNHMKEAYNLIFIGFAFHKLNMDLITVGNDNRSNDSVPTCYATSFGISKSDQAVIKKQINALYNFSIQTDMASVSCCEFFTEYWRSLSY